MENEGLLPCKYETGDGYCKKKNRERGYQDMLDYSDYLFDTLSGQSDDGGGIPMADSDGEDIPMEDYEGGATSMDDSVSYDTHEPSDIEAKIDRKRQLDAVKTIILGLSPEDQDPYTRCFVKEQSLNDIAEDLGIHRITVRNRIERIMQQIRKTL